MFLKLGQTYYATLNVSDYNGAPVNNDIPLMTIQNMQTSEYYNGACWQKQQIGLALRCVGNGAYSNQFTPDDTGEFLITIESKRYNIAKTETVEVYNTISGVQRWRNGTKYIVTYHATTKYKPVCMISSEDTGEYWSGTTWKTEPIKLQMSDSGNKHFEYTFVPKEVGKYCVTIEEGKSRQYHYTLEVTDDAEDIAPVIVTNYTLLSLDGSDSTVVADNEFPISGADVIVYDLSSKEVVAKTQTNSSGEWQLMLKPGVWQFVFQKDGYISVAFERKVV